MRKLLLFISACACFGANAAETGSNQTSGATATDGILNYSIIDDKAIVIGLTEENRSAETLSIPATLAYGGKAVSVTEIGDGAFWDCSLKEVDLGHIEKVGKNAFRGNADAELYLPATLKNIADDAFKGVRRCFIDPDARIESSHAFSGNTTIALTSVQINGNTAMIRLHCDIYKNGKPIELRIASETGREPIMPDADGVVTIDKEWLMSTEVDINGTANYIGSFLVESTDPCIEGPLTKLNIPYSIWRGIEDPAEHIYIIGDVTAWNEPNNPESGITPANAFKTPSEKNADFYEAYKLSLLEKGSRLYAGSFYLPATELLHAGAIDDDYITQFRFVTALTGWDTPEHVGAGVENFNVVPYYFYYAYSHAFMGGFSNWGILCDETTPVTVAIVLLEDTGRIWIKEGLYDVLPVYDKEYFYNVEPIFIAKNAGAEEAVTDAVDDNAPVEWYNLQGMRVAEPVRGVYIRRQGSCTSKVLVR